MKINIHAPLLPCSTCQDNAKCEEALKATREQRVGGTFPAVRFDPLYISNNPLIRKKIAKRDCSRHVPVPFINSYGLVDYLQQ